MNFNIPAQPELRIQPGSFRELPALLVKSGYRRPVLVTGGRSIRGREEWGIATDELLRAGLSFLEFTVRGEPSPELVNGAVREIRQDAPDSDVIVAVGGGSALDAGKAIAAGAAIAACILPEQPDAFDITEWLEGVGDKLPDGSTLPLIAFPTTAGTGTEASMNAVISRIGETGFKKSLRHPRFVPAIAVIDADLHEGTPQGVTRASGMDAITQLLEAFVSVGANPVSDALAELGLRRGGYALPRLLRGEDTSELRSEMALAAYLSGVCLAAAGLGVVHGLASPVGALRDIPHGVVCGLLLGPAVEHALGEGAVPRGARDQRSRYTDAARALGFSSTREMITAFYRWAEPLGKLGDYGFVGEDIPRLVEGAAAKNNPVEVSAAEMAEILGAVL